MIVIVAETAARPGRRRTTPGGGDRTIADQLPVRLWRNRVTTVANVDDAPIAPIGQTTVSHAEAAVVIAAARY